LSGFHLRQSEKIVACLDAYGEPSFCEGRFCVPSAAVAAIIRASFFWRIMASHSKWANIQHRRGAQDSRRGKVFNKLIRELTVATRIGGSDQGSNGRLRLAVDKARAAHMSKDEIDQAISRAAGGEHGAELHAVRYEGYGPGGVAVIVDCVTDNHSRTVSDVRSAFASYGGSLGAVGSVSYLFNQVGLMTYPPGTSEDRLMEVALEAGAEDVLVHSDGSMEVLTDPLDYETVRARLMADGFDPSTSDITQRASTCTRLQGEAAESMVQLLDKLDDLDDVQNVYSNAEIPDEVLARV
jgi:YebC/PmpR family DNA-binding regulatory protein